MKRTLFLSLLPLALASAGCGPLFELDLFPGPYFGDQKKVQIVTSGELFANADVREARMVGSLERVHLVPLEPLGQVRVESSAPAVVAIREQPSTDSVCCVANGGGWRCERVVDPCTGVVEPVRAIDVEAKAEGRARLRLMASDGHEVDGANLVTAEADSSELVIGKEVARRGDHLLVHVGDEVSYTVTVRSAAGEELRAPGIAALASADASTVGLLEETLFRGDTGASAGTHGILRALRAGSTTLTSFLGRPVVVDVEAR
jgi:hypothetical protein